MKHSVLHITWSSHYSKKYIHILITFMFIFNFVTPLPPLPNDWGYSFPTPDFTDITTTQFGSLHTLKSIIRLANFETKLYQALQEKLIRNGKEVKFIDKFIHAYNRQLTKRARTVNTSTTILFYRLTFRYTTIVDFLRKYYTSVEFQHSTDTLRTILDVDFPWQSLGKPKWPDWQDLYLSQDSILRLHEIYGVYPEQFVAGIPGRHEFDWGWKAINSAKIGLHALSNDLFYMAIEWLEHAEKQAILSSDWSIPIDLVLILLNIAISTHNAVLPKLNKVNADDITRHERDMLLNQFHLPTYGGEPNSDRIRTRTHYIDNNYGLSTASLYPDANFMKQCAGVTFQPEHVKSSLNCYLENKMHPYFTLIPLKVEKLSESPYILQLYDVLGNDTINWLHHVRDEPILSGLVNVSDIKELIRMRSSSGSILNDNFLHDWITYKSEIITGLTVDRAQEAPQVIEYVYGRYYGQHIDPYDLKATIGDESFEIFGNRVATLLYYIEEPELGGATPFLNVGISAQVKRGSAVFWLNMFRNGTIRDDVFHGSCPVIHGHKMAINQWIRYYSNFNKFKCSLNQME